MTEAMPFLQKYDITFLRPPTIRGRVSLAGRNGIAHKITPVCEGIACAVDKPHFYSGRL